MSLQNCPFNGKGRNKLQKITRNKLKQNDQKEFSMEIKKYQDDMFIDIWRDEYLDFDDIEDYDFIGIL